MRCGWGWVTTLSKYGGLLEVMVASTESSSIALLT